MKIIKVIKVIKVIIPICLLALLSGCGEINVVTSGSSTGVTPISSSSPGSTSAMPGSSAGSLDNAEENIYVKADAISRTEEMVLLVALHGNLLDTSWADAQVLEPDVLFKLYESLVIFEQTEHVEGTAIPANIVEAAVIQHLDIIPSHMKASKSYNRSQNTYTLGDLDEERVIAIDSIQAHDGITSIEYSIYLHNEKQSAGLLTVELGGYHQYRYLSNIVQAQEYVGVDNISTAEQKALFVAFNGSLLNTSWTDTNELNPDFLFEFYESLVILGETEYPPEGATVPADIVEAAVAQHLNITPSYMQTSTYYNRDDHSYTIGGLGQVREIALDSVKVHDGITSIEYSIYLRHEKQDAGLFTAEFGDNNYYKYLSNKVQNVN